MKNNVLFEIGLEELPARFIDDAEEQLVEKTRNWLQQLRISFDSITSFSTPRRLAVLVHGIAENQASITEEARGPAEKIAKDQNGNWSKAAIGFTKGQGKTTDDIYLKNEKGTNYIFVKKHIEGKVSKDLLPAFKSVIESIQFKQSMHWDTESIRYARPIRWLVALYNEEVIPFEIAHVKTDRMTNGHRFLGGIVSIENPLEYEDKLRENYVIADKEKREQLILEGIKNLEKEMNFHISVDLDLLNEVRNLIEFPTVFCGEYEKSFLEIPAEVLITSMKEHQRYFPVLDSERKLLPYFVSVRNGNDHEIETVVRGNEKVLRARLSDAEFFYEEDRKQSIEFFQEKLEKLVFQEKLGTIHEKVKRVVQFTVKIAESLGLEATSVSNAQRAAELCKFDLMTNMVGEFTELQGVIGEKYARHFGEDDQVATAIREHYLPIQANSKLPESPIGAVLSIADKLDTIIGFISVGLTPSGSQDPFGLRRQATGVLRILQERKWSIKLESLLEIGRKLYKNLHVNDEARDKITTELHQFFALRATYLLREKNIEPDIIEAVLYKEIGVFPYQFEKASLLSTKRNDEHFKYTQEALVRVINIAKKGEQAEVNELLLETPSEKHLYKTYMEIKNTYSLSVNQQLAMEALAALGKLADPIHSFFENNMVMVEDDQLKTNRLSLLANIASLINDFADLSQIQWKQHF